MRQLKITVILSILLAYCDRSYAQTPAPCHYKLIVNLENAPFDSLKLLDYSDANVLFDSRKIGEFTWEICIPDSTVQNYQNMALIVSRYDSTSNSSQWIRFIAEKDSSKTVVANVGVEDEINYISGTYIGKTVFPNENIVISKGNTDTVVIGDMVFEDFKLISLDDHSDISVRAEDPYFSWFFGPKELSYNDYLDHYIELSKKHRDSRYLISGLANNLRNYKSKEDVRKVYENFSDKHKNTSWSNKIRRFLFYKFQNTNLPTLNQVSNEGIIQDRSKYNLVIFTASWCAPCIKEIPLLKEIYNDLHEHLSMTFVSMDNEKDVSSFKKVIQDYNVPWRSLLAYQDIKKISEKYFVEALPHSILVYPDGEMEIIDVRDKKQKQKLYAEFL